MRNLILLALLGALAAPAASRAYARFLTEPLGRPYSGAIAALDEVKFHGAGAGVSFALERVAAADGADLLDAVAEFRSRGVRLFIVDLPVDNLGELARATRGQDVLLFNVSVRDDSLRQEQCEPHLLHVIPSNAMLMDALGQYLVSRKWREVLVLEGPSEGDQSMSAAFRRSAKRYGLEIVDVRPWVLGNNPRERDRNNIALLTSGSYDVVLVADADGEFARDVPYQTISPRPIVGSEGLAALAWHWSWERYGAPQLEGRFEKIAKRPMASFDWAAWMSVKAVAAAVQRSGSDSFETIREQLLAPDLILDGFKGSRSNFRPWNRQLRQPVLLGTHNWVVDRAPIKGFLHQTNNLDTLGFDERESTCKF